MPSCKYLVVDCEMTGGNAFENGLIQLAALALDAKGKIVAQFCTDICPPPGYVYAKEAQDITGIDVERIEKGLSYEKFIEQFMAFLQSNFKELPIVVAQFYPSDYSFLNHVLGTTFPEKDLMRKHLGHQFIDTKSLATTFNLKAELQGQKPPFPSTSLSKKGGLCDRLGVVNQQAHDALGDCLATREVLFKLLEKMEINLD